MATDGFDDRAFKDALGCFPTGITVATTCGPGGRPFGMTVSSFNSVSVDPPLVLWSITRTATYYREFKAAEYFCVNVLAADQMDISNHFSSDGDKPFTGVDYRDGIGGCPVLSGNAAQFECRAWQQYDGGDHLILVGEVMNFEQHEKQPLVFAAGAYARLASQEAG